jgi:hypothetical protein
MVKALPRQDLFVLAVLDDFRDYSIPETITPYYEARFEKFLPLRSLYSSLSHLISRDLCRRYTLKNSRYTVSPSNMPRRFSRFRTNAYFRITKAGRDTVHGREWRTI